MIENLVFLLKYVVSQLFSNTFVFYLLISNKLQAYPCYKPKYTAYSTCRPDLHAGFHSGVSDTNSVVAVAVQRFPWTASYQLILWKVTQGFCSPGWISCCGNFINSLPITAFLGSCQMGLYKPQLYFRMAEQMLDILQNRNVLELTTMYENYLFNFQSYSKVPE